MWLFVAPFSQNLWIALSLVIFFVSLMMPSVLRDASSGKPLVGGGASGLRAKASSRLEMIYHAMGALFLTQPRTLRDSHAVSTAAACMPDTVASLPVAACTRHSNVLRDIEPSRPRQARSALDSNPPCGSDVFWRRRSRMDE